MEFEENWQRRILFLPSMTQLFVKLWGSAYFESRLCSKLPCTHLFLQRRINSRGMRVYTQEISCARDPKRALGLLCMHESVVHAQEISCVYTGDSFVYTVPQAIKGPSPRQAKDRPQASKGPSPGKQRTVPQASKGPHTCI